MKILSEDYKKGFNDALETALKKAKLVYDSANITFGDRNSFNLYDELKDRFYVSPHGTVYIDRKSIMKLKKR